MSSLKQKSVSGLLTSRLLLRRAARWRRYIADMCLCRLEYSAGIDSTTAPRQKLSTLASHLGSDGIPLIGYVTGLSIDCEDGIQGG